MALLELVRWDPFAPGYKWPLASTACHSCDNAVDEARRRLYAVNARPDRYKWRVARSSYPEFCFCLVLMPDRAQIEPDERAIFYICPQGGWHTGRECGANGPADLHGMRRNLTCALLPCLTASWWLQPSAIYHLLDRFAAAAVSRRQLTALRKVLHALREKDDGLHLQKSLSVDARMNIARVCLGERCDAVLPRYYAAIDARSLLAERVLLYTSLSPDVALLTVMYLV